MKREEQGDERTDDRREASRRRARPRLRRRVRRRARQSMSWRAEQGRSLSNKTILQINVKVLCTDNDRDTSYNIDDSNNYNSKMTILVRIVTL